MAATETKTGNAELFAEILSRVESGEKQSEVIRLVAEREGKENVQVLLFHVLHVEEQE